MTLDSLDTLPYSMSYDVGKMKKVNAANIICHSHSIFFFYFSSEIRMKNDWIYVQGQGQGQGKEKRKGKINWIEMK